VLQAGRRVPWLVRWVLARRGRSYRRDPEGFLTALLQRWSRADQELFTRAEVRAMFLADLREVLVNGAGPVGMVRELQLYFRWGFQLADVPRGVPVLLWHGRQDHLVPPFMSDHVARHLGSEVTYHPGGHFMVIDHADEVVQRTRAAVA
jgi:pimeloyl-ACP methyl ester carboxylesterase